MGNFVSTADDKLRDKLLKHKFQELDDQELERSINMSYNELINFLCQYNLFDDTILTYLDSIFIDIFNHISSDEGHKIYDSIISEKNNRLDIISEKNNREKSSSSSSEDDTEIESDLFYSLYHISNVISL